jgi:16S rRNA (cytosine967-C5)-methyltransferase
MESDPGFLSLTATDRRLAQELVYGVMRQRSTLDWMIHRRTNGRPQLPALQDLLRLGLYQLFFLDRVPAHAAVHETVELAREAGFPQQSGFVNAVLRGCDRDRQPLQMEIERLKEADPAIAWSHPAWLVERWQGRFGKAGLRKMLEWDNSPPPTFVRVNTLRTTPEQLNERWATEGVIAGAVDHDWIPAGHVYHLQSHPPLAGLGSFLEGGFYVQDPSTLLAVRELDPQPGEAILDFCAAPGGKTAHIAQCLGNHGRVVAHDNSSTRLRLVSENCARLGVTCVETISPPASPGQPGTFDRVLLDAPCSNTGVLRRRLELRWRIRPEEIGRLAETQCRLLERVGTLVRPGGVLVYSTCSLESEENDAVVAAFSGPGSAFDLVRQRHLDPVRNRVDGAFVAVLRRR